MAIFDFPMHTFSTENPESSFRAKMGGSYVFSAPPAAPDQRIFKLKFRAMKYFVTAGGIDINVKPEINLARLELFYATHKTHATFTYPHPVYGDVVCSFNKPLIVPAGTEGGGGIVENIEVELLEHPGRFPSGGSDLIEIQYVDF